MKHSTSRAALGLIALSASLFLMACGSGNNTSASAPPGVALVPGTDVPVSATQSDQAAFDFVASVVAKGEADTDTPLILGDAVLAVSEIAEPAFVAA
jgi:uncharacterized lipoprotein YajG